jgi:tRNA threonylcarbamoyladenosine biosynthesis protein TsaB
VVGHPEKLLPMLMGTPTLFIGDGAALYRDLIAKVMGKDALFAVPLVPMLAGAIARLATREAMAGRLPPPDAVRPLYVRRSDAEQARDGGNGGPLSG